MILITMFASLLLLTLHSLSNCHAQTIVPNADTTENFVQETPDTIPRKKVTESLSDSLSRLAIRDSLLNLQSMRMPVFQIPETISAIWTDPYTIGPRQAFSRDATLLSEASLNTPVLVRTPFFLSTNLNRLLPYGIPVPVTGVYNGTRLIPQQFTMYEGTDVISNTQFSQLSIPADLSFHLTPQAVVPLATSETAILWENGLFNEDILNVRFSRPLARTTMVNVFSNYRFFDGQQYRQESSDLYNIYTQFADTSVIVNRGYNPLVDEYTAGLQASYTNPSGLSFVGAGSYSDWQHEIALDRPLVNKVLVYARQAVYRTHLLGALHDLALPGGLSFDLEGMYNDNVIVRHTPPRGTGSTLRLDGSLLEMKIGSSIAVPLPNDTFTIGYSGLLKTFEMFDGTDGFTSDDKPFLAYSRAFTIGSLGGLLSGDVGYLHRESNDETRNVAVIGIQGTSFFGPHQIRASFEQNSLPYDVPFADTIIEVLPLVDLYTTAGGEATLNGEGLGITLGYRYLTGVEDNSNAVFWPEGFPPYDIPNSTFTIAPRLGPWKGLTAVSSLLLSDTRPYIKSHSELKFVTNPPTTKEFVDLSLIFNYWSPRQGIDFANQTYWNRPVYDLGFRLTAHIKTFRLFYKVDNLLNQKFAYIPGYPTPGITFRWGFNWYLQV